jgi:hypothetical protein
MSPLPCPSCAIDHIISMLVMMKQKTTWTDIPSSAAVVNEVLLQCVELVLERRVPGVRLSDLSREHNDTQSTRSTL